MAKGPLNKPNPEPAGKTFGRYRVLSPLGQGAMASVFLAEDPSLGRLVAIKVIHSHLAAQKDLLTRFTSEAKTAAALRSPNIVEVFDYGLEGAAQYLVMEYIDGPTLQFVLNQQMGQPFDSKLAASLMVQAAEGLMVAERRSVVHRDIKPENLMLNSGGLLKIADFGIAHINEQSLTQTGSVLGSPSYMAPEQVEGKKPSHQTDMFALGAVFYACVTGRKPFNGANIPAIFRAICELPHRPVLENNPDADPELAQWVDMLLSKEPGARGDGAKAISGQLRQWLNKHGIYDPADYVHTHLNRAPDGIDGTMVENPTKPVAALGSPATPKPPPTPAAPAKPAALESNPSKPIPAPKTTEVPISTSSSFSSLESPESTIDRAFAATPAPSPFAGSKESQTRTNQGKGSGASTSNPNQDADFGAKDKSSWIDPLKASLLQWMGNKPKWALGAAGGIAILVLVVLISVLVSGPSEDVAANTGALSEAQVQSSQEMVPEPVKPMPPTLSVAPDTMEMQVGTRRELGLVGLPDSLAHIPIHWTIRDSGLVRLDSGWVSALKAGQTVIEASGDFFGSQVRAQSQITVLPRATAVAATIAGNAANTAAVGNVGNTSVTTKPDSSENAGASTQLTVLSAPPFAEVFIDGLFIGATPTKNKSIKAGRHRILISHRRFVSIDTQMTFKPGQLKLKFHFTQTK